MLSLHYALASRLVLKKVRDKLGLDRMKFFCSGSAALHIDIAMTFLAIGVPIMQGYGLTETSPVTSTSQLSANEWGAVGRADCRRRRQDRRRRRDPRSRAPSDARLLSRRKSDRRGASRRLAAHRRHRRTRFATDICASPIASAKSSKPIPESGSRRRASRRPSSARRSSARDGRRRESPASRRTDRAELGYGAYRTRRCRRKRRPRN